MIDREEYMKEYNEKAANVLSQEKLPGTYDILRYVNENKTSTKLKRVFDFFDDEEEFKELVTRNTLSFSEEESKDFIDTVIAANVTDISKSGSIYKMLMACGDNYRIVGENCGSKGREIQLPLNEEEFVYNVKNSYCYLGDDPKDLLLFDDYEKFCIATKGLETMHVRTPMTCKHHTRRGCCPICAGQIPADTQNVGAFATLMITEVATQNALSSMNKGKKSNVNELLTKPANGIKSLKEYYKWADEILDELQGDAVERRFYEIALLGRLFVNKKDKKVRVSSLMNPASNNYLGEFIYKPKEKTYRDMITKENFMDNSLKAQIALNSYKRGIF